MSDLSLYTKFEKLPQNLKQEVMHFMDFLIEKSSSNKKKVIPKFGSAKGKIEISPDFDAPLDAFKDYM